MKPKIKRRRRYKSKVKVNRKGTIKVSGMNKRDHDQAMKLVQQAQANKHQQALKRGDNVGKSFRSLVRSSALAGSAAAFSQNLPSEEKKTITINGKPIVITNGSSNGNTGLGNSSNSVLDWIN